MGNFERSYTPLRSKLQDSGVRGLAMDIDDSISGTNLHWASLVLDRYGHPEYDNPYEIIKAYRYVRNVPEWQVPEVVKFVENLIQSADIASSLPPVHRAKEFVSRIVNVRPLVCYLTGRPDRMKEVSHAWIWRHDFPGSDIVFQPDQDTLRHMGFRNGNEWRARLVEFLYPVVEGLIDDNVELLSYMDGYKGRFFVLGSSGQSENPNVIFCPDLSAAAEAVEKL